MFIEDNLKKTKLVCFALRIKDHWF
jgi:hypothetical protein